MKTQKQAVVELVKAALGSNYNPTEPCRDKLTKDQIEQIRLDIISGINNNTIKYGGDKTGSSLSRYVIGMITNHLRKTKELNGGKKRSQIDKKDQIGDSTYSVSKDEIPADILQELGD